LSSITNLGLKTMGRRPKRGDDDLVPKGEAADMENLRLQVWKGRRRRVKLLGRLFLIGGSASLIAGYFIAYLGLELLAGVMIPLGAFFAFAGNEPYMKSSLAGQSVVSTMQVLQEALRVNSDGGHAVFVPKSDSNRKVLMFIPTDDSQRGSTNGVGTKGHYYPPLGHELFTTYLREIGGKTEKELLPLLEQLRAVMTSGLELVEDVKFEVNESVIDVHIRNTTFAEIGKHPELVKGVYARAGCPVTNSIAEWICYGMNARVEWLDAQIDPITRGATVKLSLSGGIKK